MCYFLRAAKNHEFSCKFDDAQWEKIFQILKEFFCTSENISSVGQQSFEKEKRKESAKKSCLGWGARTDKRV